MLLRVPDFYPQFHCIADKCTDTCCVGWEVDIDKLTLTKYEHLAKQGQNGFAQTLLQNIEDGHFKLKSGDRCPFLMQGGLCELICKLGCNGSDKDESGESVLCDICREHPRFVEVYGDIMEKGVGLCCEEAARLLLYPEKGSNGTPNNCANPENNCVGIQNNCASLENNCAIYFLEKSIDDTPDEIADDVREARDAIFAEREEMFNILGEKSRPLSERLKNLLDFAEEAQGLDPCGNETDSGQAKPKQFSEAVVKAAWIEILSEGESLGKSWDEACRRIAEYATGQETAESLFSEDEGARIVTYLLFRYYAKSLFDGDSLGKVQFALFFWITLRDFGHCLAGGAQQVQAAKINAIKLLSRQMEYSDEIMEILAENFYANPAFSTEQFRKML